VAEVKSMSYDNIALETTKNAKKLFGLPPKVAEK
jgi:Tat protein secretion system quality control protein TatD with DNase activity